MNDLPTSIFQSGNSAGVTPQTNQSGAFPVSASGNKEIEPSVSASAEKAGLKEVGSDGELPPEVRSIGVKMHPTTIPIPAPLQQLGVQSTGANVSAPTLTVSLPLTDDQIAQGLTASLTSSYHWLAEWCIRRLKQMHVGLKKIHGSMTRVSE